MHLKVTHNAGVSIVHLEGDFLMEPEGCMLRAKIHDLVGKGNKLFIIDLIGVKHINSCGLGSLVCAYTTARKTGGDLRLVGTSTAVQELLNITQLVKIFEIYSTVDQAIARYQNK